MFCYQIDWRYSDEARTVIRRDLVDANSADEAFNFVRNLRDSADDPIVIGEVQELD